MMGKTAGCWIWLVMASACAQAQPSDPFDPNSEPFTEEEIAYYEKERAYTIRANRGMRFTLHMDCLEVPLLTAQALVAEPGGALDAGPLRDRLLAGIKDGTGRRVHYSSREVHSSGGDGSHNSFGTRRQEYANELAPGSGSERIKHGRQTLNLMDLGSGRVWGAEHRETGWRVAIEAALTGEPLRYDVKFSVSWQEETGRVSWPKGHETMDLPIFHQCSIDAKFRAAPSTWMLAGLMRPPLIDPDSPGKPWPDQRIVTFVKLVPAPPVSELVPMKGVQSGTDSELLLLEWWELDVGEAPVLLDGVAAEGSTGKLRPVMEKLRQEKRAVLHEMSLVPVCSGSKSAVSSKVTIPYPGETSRPVSRNLEVPKDGNRLIYPYPVSPAQYEKQDTGTRVEVAQTTSGAKLWMDVEVDAKLVVLAGKMGFGPIPLEVPQATFGAFATQCSVLLRAGDSVLAGVADAPPPPSLEIRRQPAGMNPVERQMILVVTRLK